MAASGGDDERTVVSSPPPTDTPPKKRSPWPLVALAGCAGVLCLALVVVIAVLLISEGGEFPISLGSTKEAPTAEIVDTPTATKERATETAEPEMEPTATGPAATKATQRVTQSPTRTPKPTQTPTATATSVSQEPVIGLITFAGSVTEDNQPIDPDTTFPADIDEIHAVFSYEGMSESDTWERRWYQDGQEVGVGSGTWDAGESGTFTFEIEASATSASPPATGTYRIAFARWDGGKHDLYIANTDGGGERFLLERAAGPSWSPSGQYLSIYGEEGVDRQIRDGAEYVIEGITNGILWLQVANFPSDITQVEIGQYVRDGTGRWAAWAPSGEMIAFDAARGGPDRRVYFLGTEDNQQYSIEIPGEQAAWSPNSNQVVYRSGRDDKQGIWISNRDDSGAYNITNEGNDSFPSWSPDGGTIAFHRDSGGNVDIYVMDVDGGNVRRLTDAAGPDTLPAWTPDGRIVFRSARGGSWGIYIMNADGSGQQQIIANADPGPDWAFGRMDVH
jgi:Tol biopolymer transport system component